MEIERRVSARPQRRLKAWLALGGAALGLLGAAGVAWACADASCQPTWTLASPTYDCAGRAAISPGNDTRINLVLLMRSLSPAPGGKQNYPASDWFSAHLGRTFMTWEGLRDSYWPAPNSEDAADDGADADCSASASGNAAFHDALAAETGLPDSDKAALEGLRKTLGCSPPDWNAPIASAKGREYLAYLKAADAFYADDWAAARTGFAALSHARSEWVAETASYMPIRIGLRAAVAGSMDQYGDFDGLDKVDKAAAAAAGSAISDYLKAYPQGRYAASARGLTRRVLWLQRDGAGLARIYEQMLHATPAGDEASADLAEEIDLRLLEDDRAAASIPSAGDVPLLLAISDLKRMRPGYDDDKMPLTAAELDAQAARFAGHADLFTFLQASRAWYAGEAPRGVLAAIPDNARAADPDPLSFSRQVLRGMALASAHDVNEAGFWRDLIGAANPVYQRPLVEMGLAIRWQNTGKLDQVFAPGSPVTDATTREILLQTMAGPAILRADANAADRPAHERDVARFALLYKDLSRGAYGDFTRDVALVPANANVDAGLYSFPDDDVVPVGLFTKGKWSDGFACPPIAQTAATLARTPGDYTGLLCLGDFWRLNGFDNFSLFTPAKDPQSLGSGPDAFPGKPRTRDTIYAAIIADRQAAPDLRAYALYRAVRCYAPAGYNGCAGSFVNADDMDAAAVPLAQRKAWFDELKRSYPASRWAKALRFYW